MTNPPIDISKSRRNSFRWLLVAKGAVVVAVLWLGRKILGPKRPLTRSQEKQRRKALVKSVTGRK